MAFAIGVFVDRGRLGRHPAPGTPEPTRIVQVHSGDTLWGIASELADDGDVRAMMEQIERLNALDSSVLAGRPAAGRARRVATTQTSSAASTPAGGPGKTGAEPSWLRPCGPFQGGSWAPWAVAGYSGTPLVRKLGIKDEHVVLLDGAPAGLDLDDTGGAHVVRRLPRSVDVTLTFHTSYDALAKRLPMLFERTSTAGMVWVCWPKKSAQRSSRNPAGPDQRPGREPGPRPRPRARLRRRQGGRGRRDLVGAEVRPSPRRPLSAAGSVPVRASPRSFSARRGSRSGAAAG